MQSKEPSDKSNKGPSYLWTVEEVSQYLRLKPETIRMMARRGKLPAIKVGHVWRFDIGEVQQNFAISHISDSK